MSHHPPRATPQAEKPMGPVLVILAMKGETEQLVARAEAFLRLAPCPRGMLTRTLAETQDGALPATLWSSSDARTKFHRSPEYRAAMVSSGVREIIEAQEIVEYRVRFHQRATSKRTAPTRSSSSRRSP
jgi:hypothetical protein